MRHKRLAPADLGGDVRAGRNLALVTRVGHHTPFVGAPNMDGDVAAFAQVMTIIVGSVASFVAIGLGARAVWRHGSRPSNRAPTLDDKRIERIENAVDAIAIEVERISEAQRFTTGLLAERLPARPADRVADLPQPSPNKRTNTPH
jgi:hypothetical protein